MLFLGGVSTNFSVVKFYFFFVRPSFIGNMLQAFCVLDIFFLYKIVLDNTDPPPKKHYNFTPVKMCLSEMGIAAGNVSLKALVYSYGHCVLWPSKGWRTSSVLFVLKKVRNVGIRLSSVFKRLEQ